MEELEEQIKELRQQNERFEALVIAQAQMIEKLQAQLAQNSTNSHKPPSSDPPKTRSQRRRRKSTGRKSGGQKGHKGSTRSMLPVDEVDHIVACIPTHCDACDKPLSGTDDQPRLHQVWQIPPIEVEVTQFEQHSLVCSCGCKTIGQLPDGITHSSFGPNIHAIHAWLRLDMRASIQRTKTFFEQIMGLKISHGALCAMDARMAGKMKPAHEQLGKALKQASVKHCDETTWYLDGQRQTIWAACTNQLSYMLITDKRDQLSCKTLIGEQVKGTVVTDRYCAYHYIDNEQRQMCWAHLLRDFESMAQSKDPQVSGDGWMLADYAKQMLKEYARSRDGTNEQKEQFVTKWKGKSKVIKSFLRAVGQNGCKHGGMAREILKYEDCLWTFLSKEDVEPTNNLAERTLRHAVTMRKTSYGSRSEVGLRFIERGMSIR